MKNIIKILLCSFLIVAAGVIYWPNLEAALLKKQGARADFNPAAVPVTESLRRELLVVEPSKKFQNTPVAVPEAETRIYRWVDGNGRTVFSDRPRHETAVAYTPKELGYISVNGVPEPTKQVSASAPKISTQSYKAVAVPNRQAEFRFSTLTSVQRGDYVELSGRVSGGYACKRLKIRAFAKSTTGHTVNGTDVISSKGFGSSLYETKVKKRWNRDARRPMWTPTKTEAVCLQK